MTAKKAAKVIPLGSKAPKKGAKPKPAKKPAKPKATKPAKPKATKPAKESIVHALHQANDLDSIDRADLEAELGPNPLDSLEEVDHELAAEVAEQTKKVTKLSNGDLQRLKEAAEKGDKGAIAAIEQIVTNFNAWRGAVADAADTGKACKVDLDQSKAGLQVAIESPLDPTKVEAKAATELLSKIQIAWQELKDTEAHNIERKKEAKGEIRKWSKALDRSIKESANLALDFGQDWKEEITD